MPARRPAAAPPLAARPRRPRPAPRRLLRRARHPACPHPWHGPALLGLAKRFPCRRHPPTPTPTPPTPPTPFHPTPQIPFYRERINYIWCAMWLGVSGALQGGVGWLGAGWGPARGCQRMVSGDG